MAEMMGGKRFGRGKEKKAASRKADIPLLSCQTCELTVNELLGVVASKKAAAGPAKKLTEGDVIEIMEGICDPDTDDGDWLSRLDIEVESGKLQIVDMGVPGECQEQCRTIARSCHETMEAADLGVVSEAIWKGAKRAQVTQLLCKEQTRACKKKAPKVPSNRLPGPAFKSLTEEEAKMRGTMRNLKKSGMGGTLYNREEMMEKMKDRGEDLMGEGGEEGGEPKGEL